MNLRPWVFAASLLACSGSAFVLGRMHGEPAALSPLMQATPKVTAAAAPKAAPDVSWADMLNLFGWHRPANAQPADDDQGPPDIPAIASYEDLLYSQSPLLDDAISKLRASTPGKPGLYAIGFAGDAEENVFRNEVTYLPHLLAKRFDAAGRTLELINSPWTFDTTPLATRSNLDAALLRLTQKMDRSNDILLLFLTSHGSHDHQLYVEMGTLPLDQLTPQDIRSALDDARITWRVVVISACYSGGFIPALREPHTLVITAARADRPSFGCGSDSQLTWFGKAFIVEALNRTTDFRTAFTDARQSIAQWELREHEQPSDPQIWEGPLIATKLAQWRATLPANAPAVPFAPTPQHNSR
ncbi:MAG: caspase family protein [Proteobacteria bacterium]|nr:caspase family protein [Pseudomonadota bacterium]